MTTSGSAPSGHLPPSGQQFRLAFDDQVVTVVEVGAAVREFRVGNRDVFQSYAKSAFSTGFHGAVLVPWPNRLADGRYEFDGEQYQLPITEPARMTALHGLSPWRSWRLVEQQPDRVVLSLALLPSPGFPFFLDTTIDYRLAQLGLEVRTTSRNVGHRACPYAVGFHPWLSSGEAMLDECAVTLDATHRFVTDDRLLPVAEEAVAGTPYDFREPRKLGSLVLDDAFSGVPRTNGRAWVKLAAPDGATAAIWMDESCDYWQLCTGDMLPAQQARRGLAAEPMTAAPNAFVTGRGLRRLEPGESVRTTWGACLL
ncbi:MAG TPA: aldose 1-epimerase family protein [Acidothermaceae bacterium]